MPVYYYKHVNDLLREFCDAPRNRQDPIIEIEHSIKEDAREKCPKCGHDIVRLIAGDVMVAWKNGAAPTPKTYS